MPAAGRELLRRPRAHRSTGPTAVDDWELHVLGRPAQRREPALGLDRHPGGRGRVRRRRDCTLPPGDHLSPAGGAACWAGGRLRRLGRRSPARAGLAVAGRHAVRPRSPRGRRSRRSIAAGCATLLEVSDDTNDSAADFALAPPSPANNASPPAGTCVRARWRRRWRLVAATRSHRTRRSRRPRRRRPPRRKVKITFSSTERGSEFRCKLDKGGFKPCHSPFKAKVDPASTSSRSSRSTPPATPTPPRRRRSSSASRR